MTIGERNGWRVVRLQEVPPAAQGPGASASRTAVSRIDMMISANGRRDDVGFDDIAAGERPNHPAPREHDHFVAQPLEFRRIGGIDDDRCARTR